MNIHSDSDKKSKRKYKRLVKRLTSNKDSLSGSHSSISGNSDESFYDGESDDESRASNEDEDLKNYVKDFRKKVGWDQAGRR